MAEYGKLLSRIWSDPEFTKLDARAQQVYSLLISYSTRNLAGVLPMTLKRWAGCTADATVENISGALRRLETRRFVVLDWDTEELLVRTYIRNDEVFKQPNLMQAARKFCRQVESPKLRWALFDELTKLPEHKNQELTVEVANGLIDGVDRPPAEPIAEPYGEPIAEPIAEGPGVGGYVSLLGEHQHLQPHQSPPPQASGDVVPMRQTGADMVRAKYANLPAHSQSAWHITQAFSRALPNPIPSQVLSEMATQIDKCLTDQIPPEAIARGIHDWANSDSWSPTQIPRFVAKATAKSASHGKATRKALDYDTAAEQLIAELGIA